MDTEYGDCTRSMGIVHGYVGYSSCLSSLPSLCNRLVNTFRLESVENRVLD